MYPNCFNHTETRPSGSEEIKLLTFFFNLKKKEKKKSRTGEIDCATKCFVFLRNITQPDVIYEKCLLLMIECACANMLSSLKKKKKKKKSDVIWFT